MTQEPTPAFRSYDGVFRYVGPTGHEGRCYLQVFERRGALPTVMMTWRCCTAPLSPRSGAAARRRCRRDPAPQPAVTRTATTTRASQACSMSPRHGERR